MTRRRVDMAQPEHRRPPKTCDTLCRCRETPHSDVLSQDTAPATKESLQLQGFLLVERPTGLAAFQSGSWNGLEPPGLGPACTGLYRRQRLAPSVRMRAPADGRSHHSEARGPLRGSYWFVRSARIVDPIHRSSGRSPGVLTWRRNSRAPSPGDASASWIWSGGRCFDRLCVHGVESGPELAADARRGAAARHEYLQVVRILRPLDAIENVGDGVFAET